MARRRQRSTTKTYKRAKARNEEQQLRQEAGPVEERKLTPEEIEKLLEERRQTRRG